MTSSLYLQRVFPTAVTPVIASAANHPSSAASASENGIEHNLEAQLWDHLGQQIHPPRFSLSQRQCAPKNPNCGGGAAEWRRTDGGFRGGPAGETQMDRRNAAFSARRSPDFLQAPLFRHEAWRQTSFNQVNYKLPNKIEERNHKKS